MSIPDVAENVEFSDLPITSIRSYYVQVLGGVSDEQAAEAAAHQTEAAEAEADAVEDGDGPDDGDDLQAMENGDEEAAKTTNDAEDESLEAVDADTADPNRKSGKKRNQDGQQAGAILLKVINTTVRCDGLELTC